MTLPIVWSIAGSDSSGGAGIEADIKTCHSLGVHTCSIITAITAQNNQKINSIQYTPVEFIADQMMVLKNNLPPVSIKIGMLGNAELIRQLASFLKECDAYVVLDPVLFSSTGAGLFSTSLIDYLACLKLLFPYIDVLTPNVSEAEALAGFPITSQNDIECAAKKILEQGIKSIVIKGGHFTDDFSQDYWTNGSESFWMANKRLPDNNYRGTGCVFSSAISACLALGYDVKDAVVIAKMYVNTGIRNATNSDIGAAFLAHKGWPEDEKDLPYLSQKPVTQLPEMSADCDSQMGLYPVIDSVEWIKKLIPLGVKTIQLRVKNKKNDELEDEIKGGISLAKQNNIRLYINDYWELAIEHGAYGVHLGQDDLGSADIKKIKNAGLRLGVSTHCYYEVARAHSLNPSYIACGPVYPTTSKVMPFSPQGIQKLQRWRRTLRYKLVAIGGINLENIEEVITSNVNGVAMISAITQSNNYVNAVEILSQYCGR